VSPVDDVAPVIVDIGNAIVTNVRPSWPIVDVETAVSKTRALNATVAEARTVPDASITDARLVADTSITDTRPVTDPAGELRGAVHSQEIADIAGRRTIANAGNIRTATIAYASAGTVPSLTDSARKLAGAIAA
jgi:hypothetical protein